MVVWILNNRFFNRGLAHLVLRLHVHLISQMIQEHVKGLKSSRSKRLPVLLRVLWELAQKKESAEGQEGNGAIKCVKSHCYPQRQVLF